MAIKDEPKTIKVGVMDIWQAENLSGFSNGHLVGWLFQPTFLYL